MERWRGPLRESAAPEGLVLGAVPTCGITGEARSTDPPWWPTTSDGFRPFKS